MILVAGCARNINSPSPQTGVFQDPPQAKESVLLLPMSLEIGEVQNFVIAQLPFGVIHAERRREGNTTRWNYEIRRDQPIQFTAAGNELIFKIPLRVNAGGSYTACAGYWSGGRCRGISETERGTTSVNVEVLLKARLTINPDYSVIVNTFLDASVMNNPHLQMNLIGDLIRINIPIRDRIEGALGGAVARIKPEIDRKIAEYLANFNIRNELAVYWEQVKEPVALDQYWLNIAPKAIYFENLQSDGNRLFLTVGAGAAFRLSDQKLPPSPEVLPDLQFTGNKPGMFNIHLPIDLSFAKISEEVRKQVVDKKYEKGKMKVTLKDVSMKGIQLSDTTAGILAKLSFKGRAGFFRRVKGDLYFTAVPAYDKDNNLLYVSRFSLTPETNNVLINKGVPWLLENFYYEELKQQMRYDFSGELAEYATLLQSKLDTVKIDKLTVHGKLEKLSFEGFHINKDALHLLIRSNGTLKTEPIIILPNQTALGRQYKRFVSYQVCNFTLCFISILSRYFCIKITL